MGGIDGEDCMRQTSPMGKTKTAGKFGKDFPTVFIYRFSGIPASLYPRGSSEIVFKSIECSNARSMDTRQHLKAF